MTYLTERQSARLAERLADLPRLAAEAGNVDISGSTVGSQPPPGTSLNAVDAGREQPRLLVESFLQSLPQTLFVLLPIFALLLKVFYLFKRRLYMEHLIVALHSHAFLCAALLLVVGLGSLRDLSGGTGSRSVPR